MTLFCCDRDLVEGFGAGIQELAIQGTATAAVHVVKVSLESVSGGDYIGEELERKIYATAQGLDDMTIKLKLEPEGIATPTITWNGGAAGMDSLERMVSASSLKEFGESITATYAGEDVFKGKVYVFEGKPADAAATVTTTLTLSSSINLDPSWFGGFSRGDAESKAIYDYQVYYENKKWKAVLNSVTCPYRYNIQSLSRVDITNGSIDPFPYGLGMSSNSTQVARRERAVSNFTPDADGIPLQGSYWCSTFVDDHERFHYADWTGNHYGKVITQAETTFEQIEKPVTVNNLDPYSMHTIMGSDLKLNCVFPPYIFEEGEYLKNNETDAFLNGKADFQALADEIESHIGN